MNKILSFKVKSMPYVLVLFSFFSFNNTQAQCPVVPVSPQVICDAAGFDFNDLNAFATAAPGNTVRWYLNPTGGTALPQSQLVQQGTYYAGDPTGTCGTRSPLIVDFTVDPSGQNLDNIFCSNESPTIQTYIDQTLSPNIPMGGSVEIYSDFQLMNQMSPSMVLSGNANYFIVFVDNNGCRGQIERASTAVFPSPAVPTPNAVQQFCSDTNPTVNDLNPGTTDNFNWFENVDGMNIPIPPALTSMEPLVDGRTYYLQANNFFCDSDVVSVVVEINDPVNAGNNATQEYCEDNIPTADFDLFPLLGPLADAGGSWNGPIATNNGDQGTVNIAGQPIGVYNFVYTVSGIGACPEATATVSIEILEILSSGTASALSPVSFCVSQLPTSYDLSLLLDNEDVGGTWTLGTSSADPVVMSPIDLTIFTAGTYDFTYSQNLSPNPCPENSTTVRVIVLEDPNAGDAVLTEICENDLVASSPYDLFNSLDGTQDNNLGVWTDAMNSVVSNSIDISGFNVAGAPYTYTYTIDNGFCQDSQVISIDVLPAPESGNYVGTPFTVCEDQAAANSPYDLFNLLDGTQDANGTWFIGNNSAGLSITNPIDLTSLGNGSFEFTYAVPNIGTCSDVDVTVTVVINPLPNTGTPTPFLVCENDLVANSPLDLFNQLTGQDAGGIWSDDDATGALTGSTVDLTGLVVGDYDFSYSITDANGCMNSSVVSISVATAPESGNYVGTPFTVCEDQAAANSPYDLFNLLDGTQDANGSWFIGNNSAGTTVTNPIDLTSLGNGSFDFTYAVPDIGTCSDVDVTVTVVINPLPNTGTPSPFLVCENDLVANSPLDLFNQLTGEDAGGIWSDDDATGALTGSTVDLTGLVVGDYDFSYSITDANGCMNSSVVTISVATAPESGNYVGTPFTVCEDQAAANSPYDLFNLLDGTQDANGTWFIGNNSAGLSITNPIDLISLGNGSFDFTYAVPDIGTCSDVDVTVTIIIDELAAAGIATPFVVCENELTNNSPLDLFGQLTGQDAGGTWSDDDATGALSGSNVDLIGFAIGNYNFTYTVNNGSCSSSQTVLVSVVAAPNAGTGTDFEICLSDVTVGQTLDLFNQLANNDLGGSWSDDDTTGELNGSIVDISNLASGTYNFTYTVVPSANCNADTETIQIILNDTAAPTASAIQDFCDQATVADLSSTGNNIQWYADAALTTPLNSTDLLIDGEDYFATQTDAVTNCESNDSAAINVNIFVSPNSGVAIPITTCNDQNMVDLFTALDGSQDSTGTWMDTDGTGAVSGYIFDATAVSNGSYNFEYLVTGNAPCTDASTIVTIVVESPVNAGTDATLDICSDGAITDLFSLLGASASTGGTWSPALTSGTGVFDPLVDPSSTYTYTLTNSCNTSTAEVIVNVTEAPNAGTNNSITVCVVDGTFDLLTQLGGTPDDTGVWNPLLNSGTNIFDPAIDGTGIFTYTVEATGPCSTDAVATLDIQVNESVAPTVVNTSIDFCETDEPTIMDLDVTVTGTMIFWYDSIDGSVPLAGTDSLVDGASYFATQTGPNGCESSMRVEVLVAINDAPTPTLLEDGELFCINDNPTLLQLTLNIIEYDSNLNNVIWYNAVDGTNALPLSTIMTNGTTYYAVLLDPATGCESSVRLAVTVDLSACGDLVIPDGFSPNGDGVNDVFDIDNLDFLYPNFSMEFYNRYGNLVYQGTANTPRFNGFSNQSALLNDGELPVGVYYYILKYNDGTTKPRQGRIYLSR